MKTFASLLLLVVGVNLLGWGLGTLFKGRTVSSRQVGYLQKLETVKSEELFVDVYTSVTTDKGTFLVYGNITGLKGEEVTISTNDQGKKEVRIGDWAPHDLVGSF